MWRDELGSEKVTQKRTHTQSTIGEDARSTCCVVVQLVVKRAFDFVQHRAALKSMRLQSLNFISMALNAAIWNGSCMKPRLGTVMSNEVQTSSGLPHCAPVSPVSFTIIMELVLRDMI